MQSHRSSLASFKDLSRFKEEKKLVSDSADVGGSSFSHTMSIVKKQPPAFSNKEEASRQKYQNNWFEKKDIESKLLLGLIELVAQEFRRANLPTHPKTRIGVNSNTNKYSVLSKGVEGYQSLDSLPEEDIRAGIKKGSIKGLGSVLILALFLAEIDLKLGNLGLDKDGNVVNIDGDLCFSSLFDVYKYKNFDIISSDIDQLPYINHYYACNWLDLLQYIKADDSVRRKDDPKTIDPSISQLPHFRKEVNQAILNIICLPDEWIRHFVESYVSDEFQIPQDAEGRTFEKFSTILINQMIDRRDQLRTAALSNTYFKNYLLTKEAKADLKQHIAYLENFKVAGKERLADKLPSLKEDMLLNFYQLRPFSKQCVDKGLSTWKKNRSKLSALSSRFFNKDAKKLSQQLEHQADVKGKGKGKGKGKEVSNNPDKERYKLVVNYLDSHSDVDQLAQSLRRSMTN
jgi:hypothetical protein